MAYLISPTTQEGVSDDIDAAVQPSQDILDEEINSEMQPISNKPTPKAQNFNLPQVQKQSDGSQAASVLAGGISGAEVGSAVLPGWGTAIGFVVGAVGTWWGTESQKQAADKANASNEGEEEKRLHLLDIQTGKQDKANQEAKNLQSEEIQWKENDADFLKSQAGMSRLLEVFNNQNGFKQALEQGYGNMMNAKKSQMYNFKGLNPIGRS
jgi:hypothetical protein